MFASLPRLATSPGAAWTDIRTDHDHHPWGFLPLMLLGPLIPAICVYIGGAHIGWEVFGNDTERQLLKPVSAATLGLMVYLGFLTGLVIMGVLTRWVLFKVPQRPSFVTATAFMTVVAVPMMLAGFVGLVPYRPAILLVALLASALSAILLFFGLPNYMKMSRNDSTRFLGVCILALGIITVVTTAFYFQEFWREPITGNYRNLIDS
ncbi:Yip1 family protein [Halopseudomonas sp.]|jgi:hypothetical protein|uniref:Yip1 family protein n=1 Tax=Halopseudomonas sp. TaxID=2901191 RepID=UPI001A4F45C4|nr:DUF1282 family protein [Pseudomonas sp.]